MTDQLHQDSLSEQIERIIGKDPRVLGTFEYRHILSEVHALEAENAKLKNERDSIAAKAFEMAAQAADTTISSTASPSEAIRALSPASARRQLQLDLLRARLEEAKWWHETHAAIHDDCVDCVCCRRLARLESEISALEAQRGRETT